MLGQVEIAAVEEVRSSRDPEIDVVMEERTGLRAEVALELQGLRAALRGREEPNDVLQLPIVGYSSEPDVRLPLDIPTPNEAGLNDRLSAIGEDEEEDRMDADRTPASRLTTSTMASVPSCSSVKVDRGFLGMNMLLDHTGKGIHIIDIKDGGAMAKHNSEADDDDDRVQPNDFVTSINGSSDMREMLDIIQAERVLDMELVRPVPVRVRVRRFRKPWGMKLTYQNISVLIEIVEVNEGAMQEHNSTADLEEQVLPGDFIESINGVTGVERMMRCLKSCATELDIKLLRLAGPETPTECDA